MPGQTNLETTPAEGAGERPPSNVNLLSPESLLNPFPIYQQLRQHDPVHWLEAAQAWIITRHHDVMNSLRDPRLSANRTRFYEYQLKDAGPEIVKDLVQILGRQMGMKDGAEHLRLRRLVNPGFSPHTIDSLVPAIRRTMTMLLDQVQSRGRMDLVKEISYQLPPLIIAEMLGVPAEDRQRFQVWVQPIADFSSPVAGADPVELARRANTAMQEICAYVGNIVEERRRSPGHDILSMMIHSQTEGAMSADELVANAMLILSAGHVTTTDQISNAVHDLLTHPEQLRMLQEDKRLLKSAVEEIVRFTPAVPFVARIALEDFKLHGRDIRKGAVVFVGIASANRDGDVFPEPERFDITRDYHLQKHLSFAFGPHHCMGAGLARRELEVAVELLIERLPDLRLDEEQAPVVKCNNLILRGFNSLPVRW
jgi:cytochrome P450 PksS